MLGKYNPLKEGSLPTKVKQVKKVKGVKPPKDSKKAKEFFKHHVVHNGPHIKGQGAEHATYDFDDDDYEVDGGLQKRKDKQKRGYEPVESVNERKNPKREKLKKDFKTSLKFAKGVIRKIDTFMKSNDWGVVDGFVTNKRTGLASLVKDMEKSMNQIIKLPVDESVNEATSLGADMLLGGLAQVIRKAGMKPKTAKMMGGGFKVSKRDKVGFKMDVEIRGRDKKQTHKLQFEMERGMLYVIIKNKPVKLGKYTMVNPTAQNLKKVGSALIGETVNEAFVNNLKQAMSYINTDTKDGKEFMKLMKQKSYTKQQGIRAMTLAMRGSAIHGAGPGGVSQFTMHIAKNVKGLK